MPHLITKLKNDPVNWKIKKRPCDGVVNALLRSQSQLSTGARTTD